MEIMVKILNLSTRAAAGISFWAKRGANLAESNLLPQASAFHYSSGILTRDTSYVDLGSSYI
jgi:hypothetical protein